MPDPLSVTRTRLLPPPAVAISIRVAPASIAFSINSFVALAGRSMTSPAAIWLIRVSGRSFTDMSPFSGILRPEESAAIGLSSAIVSMGNAINPALR
ncbi:hypothetical protein D3C87_1462200 [compost metagenome]